GGVGYGRIHVHENDTGPDDCNHAQLGAFVLAGPGVPAAGAIDDARLLDIAPTLLTVAGYDVPPSMQGRNILDLSLGEAGRSENLEGAFAGTSAAPSNSATTPPPSPTTGDDIVRERLKGLGYLA
ncbi:MAG: hypothetical protein MUO50_06840, partial [Longimicrobiales bacterium]|nr:hypothetical protein [Longimicrobiales bacterium]